ncbi:hypothetical protein UFOVP1313_2 [uncultured Caudovirales phage]|uniref:Uncharacterized protein n=1 Tax=uncultured Caudovirales phage TaxID=2100421 RepID=A0A6J5RYN8_9CAUD|nr:hypothetical protein UFOVP1313_2 [uncultured Caudovirales phage]
MGLQPEDSKIVGKLMNRPAIRNLSFDDATDFLSACAQAKTVSQMPARWQSVILEAKSQNDYPLVIEWALPKLPKRVWRG